MRPPGHHSQLQLALEHVIDHVGGGRSDTRTPGCCPWNAPTVALGAHRGRRRADHERTGRALRRHPSRADPTARASAGCSGRPPRPRSVSLVRRPSSFAPTSLSDARDLLVTAGLACERLSRSRERARDHDEACEADAVALTRRVTISRCCGRGMERSQPVRRLLQHDANCCCTVSAMMLAGCGSSIGTDSGTNGDNSMGSSPAPPVSTQPPRRRPDASTGVSGVGIGMPGPDHRKRPLVGHLGGRRGRRMR